MGTGYTRNDTANNIADGNVINASDLDGEFDAVQAAFNASSGHSHDGTTGEGPQIDASGIANNAVALGTKTTGNYVATGAVSGVGLSGSASAEGATFTVTSNATNANTASTIVARDSSGDFSAGTITASLTGDVTGNVTGNVSGTAGSATGNAATATALQTARNIGGVSFDGTGNINLPGVNTAGNQDTSGNAATATALETARTIHGVSFDGTANIDLSEVVQDTVGAMFSSNTETGITATYQDGDGTIDLVVGTLNQDTTGNAATATALETARTIAGQSFDGTGNITIASSNLSDGSALLKNVVEDTSPQLGGDLDLNNNNITGTGNIPAANLTGTLPAIDGSNLTGVTSATNLLSDTSPQLGGNLDLNSKTINGSGTINYTGSLTQNGNTALYNGTLKLDGSFPTGTENSVVGEDALVMNNPSGASRNTVMGFEAAKIGADNSFDDNVIIGHQALTGQTDNGGNNILNSSHENVAIGSSALKINLAGDENVAVGYRSMYNSSGTDGSTAVGYLSLFNFDNSSGATGKNTAIGSMAGHAITTGAKNTLIGCYDGNSGGLDIRTSDNNIVLSDGDGNIRQYIDSTGDMRFNCTSTLIAGDEVYSFQGGGSFNIESGNTNSNLYLWNRTNSGTNDNVMFYYGTAGNNVGSIKTNSAATAFNTSSDYRLKENVTDMTDAIARVKQLAPKRFNFIVDANNTVDGFLAHEAQTVVPEAVHGTHNEVDDDGNAVMQGIDHSKLVPLLTGALQEAIAKIETLETKVAALEAGS